MPLLSAPLARADPAGVSPLPRRSTLLLKQGTTASLRRVSSVVPARIIDLARLSRHVRHSMKYIRSALLGFSSAAFLAIASAQPSVTPDLAVMNLDDLGVYAVGCAYRGQPEQ